MKSGVDFKGMQRRPAEKDAALAAMETLKANSGLFDDESGKEFIAPHFCSYKAVENGLLPSLTKLNHAITSYKAKDSSGAMFRHFLGECVECGKRKIAAEKVVA